MAGSKGPAIMLIKGQSQYRQAFIFALGNKDYAGAVLSLIGMASILPKEAKFKLPEPPKEIFNQVINFEHERTIKKWLIEWGPKVEEAVSQYVHRFYRLGATNL